MSRIPTPTEIRARAWLLVDGVTALDQFVTEEGIVLCHRDDAYTLLAPGQPRQAARGRAELFVLVERALAALVPA